VSNRVLGNRMLQALGQLSSTRWVQCAGKIRAAHAGVVDGGAGIECHDARQRSDHQTPGKLIDVAWFNAGLRIFDISDARMPREVGYFMPPERPDLQAQSGVHASPIDWSEELAVDSRGNIFMNDDKWGLFMLRYTGEQPK
jgi:hypothetical protein